MVPMLYGRYPANELLSSYFPASIGYVFSALVWCTANSLFIRLIARWESTLNATTNQFS